MGGDYGRGEGNNWANAAHGGAFFSAPNTKRIDKKG